MTKLNILHDGPIDIATGRSRKETNWKNRETLWSKLVEKLSTTHRTAEKYTEYLSAKKARQDEIKDIGGFVGGYVQGGRRKATSILHRQLITLDIDFGQPGIWEDFTIQYNCAAAIYSTHKHCPEAPRLRLIIPLDRKVVAEEYTAISRRIAGVLGIDNFDHTTFEPSRLMYWPSTAKDGEYEFHYQDGNWLSADEILNTYHNWADASEWPQSSRENSIIQKSIQKQGDPLEKPGIIGAFCRTYNIHEAIETFLGDVYESCDVENRYTYKEGSTAAGLVIYDDKYAYSHHGTDPTSGKLCNAFDLVRIHKYGLQDEDVREGTPGNKLPSYTAMQEFCTKIPAVAKLIVTEKMQGAADAFEGIETDDDGDDSWTEQLEVDKKGNVQCTIDNIVCILENDPRLKRRIGFNEFEQRECIMKLLPWKRKKKDEHYFTDSDVSALIHYLEKAYEISSAPKVDHALKIIFSRYSFNPIRDYLKSLDWDGEERLETLLIDYMGAEDSEYVRAVTRKSFTAAVARIFHPGIKYDYMLTLVGKQGIGKSSLIQKMAVEDTWYSESFPTVHGKEAQESVQGVWLGEMGELAGLRRADVESIKHFISTRYDRYRVAYGKRTENFPRQCIFFGTTNNREFLKDQTGNRRFWPVDTNSEACSRNVHEDLTREVVDQLWAEAVQLYKQKEPLHLTPELEEFAVKIQEEFTEKDDRIGAIKKYLDTLLPTNWNELDLWQRRDYLRGDDGIQAEGTEVRDKVCIAEIWCELFGGQAKEMTSFNTKDLHNIMQNMPGWVRSKNTRRFKNYGDQRAYLRVKIGQKSLNAGAVQRSTQRSTG